MIQVSGDDESAWAQLWDDQVKKQNKKKPHILCKFTDMLYSAGQNQSE